MNLKFNHHRAYDWYPIWSSSWILTTFMEDGSIQFKIIGKDYYEVLYDRRWNKI